MIGTEPTWKVFESHDGWLAVLVDADGRANWESEVRFDTYREASAFRDSQLVPAPKTGLLVPEEFMDALALGRRIRRAEWGLVAVLVLWGLALIGLVAAVDSGWVK